MILTGTSMFSGSIDQAKGIAILLVVLGHINSPFSTFIFTFHMPLFFFLGGIFINVSYTNDMYLRKGARRLLAPFLIFGSLGLMATLAKNILLGRPLDAFGESLFGLLYWMDAQHMNHYGTVLWFLPAIFWGRTIVFICVKYLKVHPVILIGLCVSLALVASRYITLPFGLDKGIVALPWIMFGYVFYQYRERWLSIDWLGVMPLMVLLFVLHNYGDVNRLDLATKNIGNIFITLPYTFSIIFLIIWSLYKWEAFASKHQYRCADVMMEFGKDSMLVMVFHVYTNNAFDKAVSYLLGSGHWFATFFLSTALLFVMIKIKRSHPGQFIFKYI